MNTIGYIVLYCNRVMILFTRTIHTEQTQSEENIFQSFRSAVPRWRSGAGMALTGKRREDGAEEAGGGRAEGWSATGAGRQAAVSLMPDVAGEHTCIFESSQLKVSSVQDLMGISKRSLNRICSQLFFAQ